MPDTLPPGTTFPPKARPDSADMVLAANAHIRSERAKPGGGPPVLPRQAAEQAIKNATGMSDAELDASLVEIYDQAVELGLLSAR